MFESGLYIWLIIPSANLTDGFSIICSCVSLVCSVNLSNLIWQSVWSVHLFGMCICRLCPYVCFVLSICVSGLLCQAVWSYMSTCMDCPSVWSVNISVCLVCSVHMFGTFCLSISVLALSVHLFVMSIYLFFTYVYSVNLSICFGLKCRDMWYVLSICLIWLDSLSGLSNCLGCPSVWSAHLSDLTICLICPYAILVCSGYLSELVCRYVWPG